MRNPPIPYLAAARRPSLTCFSQVKMMLLLSPLGLSTGFGLSPSSCLLPHISPTAPSFTEHDELLGSRNLGNPASALLKAPMQNVSMARRASITMSMPTDRMTRRRAFLLGAASLAALPRDAAADVAAMEVVEQVGLLSMQARSLQFAIREAPASRTDDALRTLVARERPVLQQLAAAMTAAAPALRLCTPGVEDCDCVSDPARMRAAARYAAAASARVGALDAALATVGGLTRLQDGSAYYEGGKVEQFRARMCTGREGGEVRSGARAHILTLSPTSTLGSPSPPPSPSPSPSPLALALALAPALALALTTHRSPHPLPLTPP